ncbi:hypothetical protein GDO86_009360 [Hymenochirus boettgeri]|uniref:ZBR-type domain-containing protein n=1 Tax=Hymenochirus boettgeri TaxID=247094 RepID=A0A8T2JKW9_9PIPI|nr:hypothetical protein GDO86_009360 [Hymenochirus boettgeri]
MKCGFTSNQSPKKHSPMKQRAANTVLEPSQLGPKNACKNFEMVQGSYLESRFCTLVTKCEDATEELPVHNKENVHQVCAKETHDNIENISLQDSGYSSVLHNDSQFQDETDILVSEIKVCETPKSFIQSQKSLNSSTKYLPVLRFEEAVCSTLKKMSKTSQKIDWDAVDEVVSRGNFGLENLIGKSMGVEKFDILAELFRRDFKHLLTKVLRHLSAVDLINIFSVSSTWRKILQKDPWAYNLINLDGKNFEKKAKVSIHTATRDAAFCRLPLASVQRISSTPLCNSKKKQNKNKNIDLSCSRHTEFVEVAQTLRKFQSLKFFRDCCSPAKYDSFLHRAVCTRESCKFDFCTLCLCNYHFSRNCQTSKPLSHQYPLEPLPGSKKSKQNLRRL